MPVITIPWIAAIIPTFGAEGVELAANCLRSMTEVHAHLHIQKIVVDDGSTPDVQRQIVSLCETFGAEPVLRQTNGGFAYACNDGLRRSNAVVSVLVNNDIEFEHGYPVLQALGDTTMSLNAGVVGARLLYPDRKVQHGGVAFIPHPTDLGWQENGETRKATIPGYWDHVGRNGHEFDPAVYTLHSRLVTGALLAISRGAIETVGLLDIRYGMAVEDIDYQLDCIIAGLPVYYNGFVHAFHHEGKTRGRTPEEKQTMNPDAWDREKAALVRFFEKFAGVDLSGFEMA